MAYPTKRTYKILADEKVIESDFFLIKEKPFTCFADLTRNVQYQNYFHQNKMRLSEEFSKKKWTFINSVDHIINEDLEALTLSYYFPYAAWKTTDLLQQIASKPDPIGNTILRHYGYNGLAKTGFLIVIDNKYVFVAKKEEESIEDFVDQHLNYLQAWKQKIFYAIPRDYDLELDDETRKIVFEIRQKLNELKLNGKFFAVAPVLLTMIEEVSKTAPKISRMVIDREFRILLPDYQNREIKLSHLTKSLYFLFLKHPKGIYCSDFKIYKEEIFEIYKTVSYRLDLERMQESITELSNPDGKALRIHISRIKSAFAREFSDYYASKYYIIGHGVKTVLLDRDLLSWEVDI